MGEQVANLFPILYMSRYLLHKKYNMTLPAELVSLAQLAAIPIAYYLLPYQFVMAIWMLVQGALMFLVCYLENKPTLVSKMAIAVSITVASVVLWVLDVTGLGCKPDSFIQMHAIWHVITAVAMWYCYTFCRALEDRPSSIKGIHVQPQWN